jgi:hypothetical protein
VDVCFFFCLFCSVSPSSFSGQKRHGHGRLGGASLSLVLAI